MESTCPGVLSSPIPFHVTEARPMVVTHYCCNYGGSVQILRAIPYSCSLISLHTIPLRTLPLHVLTKYHSFFRPPRMNHLLLFERNVGVVGVVRVWVRASLVYCGVSTRCTQSDVKDPRRCIIHERIAWLGEQRRLLRYSIRMGGKRYVCVSNAASRL